MKMWIVSIGYNDYGFTTQESALNFFLDIQDACQVESSWKLGAAYIANEEIMPVMKVKEVITLEEKELREKQYDAKQLEKEES